MKLQDLYKDIFTFLCIFIVSVFAVQFLPDIFRKMTFIFIFILAWTSKKDYLWIAITLVYFSSPANFFPQGSSELIYRLPLFNIAPGLSFNTTDILVILFFIKALIKEKIIIQLKQIIYPFILLLILALIFGLYFSNSLDHLATEFRLYFTYTMFYSFIKLIRTTENIYKLYILLITILPIVFINQILGFFDSGILVLFGKDYIGNIVGIEGVSDVKRVAIFAVLILFWLLIYSFVFIYNNKNNLIQLLAILFICSIFFLSATRFWISTGIIMLILSFLLGKRNKFGNYIFVGLLFIGLFYLALNLLGEKQIIATWERFYPAIKEVASGNMDKIETVNTRLNALEIIKEYIAINPITGLGFSELNFYSNDHGFWNTIITFGYFGFAVFLSIFIYIYYSLIKTWRTIGKRNPYYYPLRMLFIGFTGMMLGYATTWDFFHTGPDKIYFSTMFIGSISIYLLEARNSHFENILNK